MTVTETKPLKKFDRRSVRYKELTKAHNYIKWYDNRGRWPTHSQISKHMDYNGRCDRVTDLLTDLVLAGMIVRVPIPGRGRKRYNYTVIK